MLLTVPDALELHLISQMLCARLPAVLTMTIENKAMLSILGDVVLQSATQGQTGSS